MGLDNHVQYTLALTVTFAKNRILSFVVFYLGHVHCTVAPFFGPPCILVLYESVLL